ncbi:cupin domain-containing protein [Pseudoduganella armeniaca]|uniref:Cupin domain-containing protein n=1 Tax=Pseudoduganella armeniaca TaxID=2072590 RepID=A0A2R4C4M5_9BURK|nr:cupin domain-containing protein [Pseudoduganella armeniaca]AVR94530.1 cupin domain-containing protein [Pseudoduganella armeniaca]
MKSIAQLTAGTIALALLAAPALAQEAKTAVPPKFDSKGIARTETVRRAFDSQREAIQVRVDFAPGASFPKHSHPGVEIAYVLSGTIEYEMDGKTIRLQAGESLYIPAGAVHSAKNIGNDVISELATYVVEKNQPIVILAK